MKKRRVVTTPEADEDAKAIDELVQEIEPRPNRFVLFAVRTVQASRPRLSIVCEQYALAPMRR